ncbi:MAG: TetR family transcriptional regulator [Gammaproteobacteria bacterium]|nr:TetR family transcriptional regulator [Gammaproteobacteria bacterium]
MKQLIHSTRDRILAAAEELFAETGIAATSLRTITALARVNLAAVNYHFGSKDALIEAVYERRLRPLNQARLERLERLERAANGSPPEVAEIVDAYVDPILELGNKSNGSSMVFSRLLAQTYSDASQYVHKMFSTEQESVLKRFKKSLRHALPELSDAEICWRMHFMAGALNNAIADIGALNMIDDKQHEYDLEKAVAQLKPFLVAGLQAPGNTR